MLTKRQTQDSIPSAGISPTVEPCLRPKRLAKTASTRDREGIINGRLTQSTLLVYPFHHREKIMERNWPGERRPKSIKMKLNELSGREMSWAGAEDRKLYYSVGVVRTSADAG